MFTEFHKHTEGENEGGKRRTQTAPEGGRGGTQTAPVILTRRIKSVGQSIMWSDKLKLSRSTNTNTPSLAGVLIGSLSLNQSKRATRVIVRKATVQWTGSQESQR